mmetsp:Transcript_14062/g.44361  ORF Transcript_14062/g.44361 Transcript_14062/m.44361 type:complete len:185 (-) Transcript_14062:39-593(-)|eukprot:CAMPEP_0197388548 /NCGR_PEP_ID=MMETSP1165-20131217/1138_1 /TAXON_ID=284809 /ORGANISM="Chrysocystis fragilis, Strain CCMP3189" /LENGTH=184 /DNA_ID=CAMNT_0042913895 /DNA_START=24 /DNA_END=578 /DNA_ORIENTATION=+
MKGRMNRSYSEQFFSGTQQESEQRNVAVEWLRNRSTVLCGAYLLFLGLFYGAMTTLCSPTLASTLTNITHGLLTFLGLHWAKGSPDPVAQGEYDGLTVWEQIDGGVPWTTSKKIFMLVPTIMMLLALNATNYDKQYMAVNLPFYALCIIPKLPLLHGVRIFGINSTVGIDDVVTTPSKLPPKLD